MASLATLQTWLTAAETARHALLMGQRAVSVNVTTGGGSRAMSYTAANKADLDSYIADLERQIAALQGTTTKRTYRIHQSGRGY